MITRNNIGCLLLLLPLALMGCGSSTTIKPFSSDGCSLFSDGTLEDRTLWCQCCFEHDIAYWRGGTEAERKAADEVLRNCILERTGKPAFAEFMYKGVRFGGAAIFPTWYRWGYGWAYGRENRPLTIEEKRAVQEELNEYYKKEGSGYCEE